MPSWQPENGRYTRIANAILQALVAYPWTTPVQPCLVLHVVRHSYGFNRKKARRATITELVMALSQPRGTVHRALQTLLAAGVLVRDEEGRLALNKDYESWRAPVPPMERRRRVSVPPMERKPSDAFPSESVPPMERDSAAASVPPMERSVPPMERLLYRGTERQLERQTNIEGGRELHVPIDPDAAEPMAASLFPPADPLEGFAAWYADYPEKKARGAAERAWRKLKPSPDLRAQLSAAVAAQKRQRAEAAHRRDFVPSWPYPATWLNQKRWLDVVTPAAPAAPSSGAPKAPAGKYAAIGERHETA